MDFATLVLACVIHLTSGGSLTHSCDTPFIHDVAVAVEESSLDFNVPPDIIAAVIYHESRFKQYARSNKGAIGLMQILRHGAVQGQYLKMSFKRLSDVSLNIHLGTAYLAQILPRCSTYTGGLTCYWRGPAKGCSSSKYSRCILADLRKARRNIGTILLTDYWRAQINSLGQ